MFEIDTSKLVKIATAILIQFAKFLHKTVQNFNSTLENATLPCTIKYPLVYILFQLVKAGSQTTTE